MRVSPNPALALLLALSLTACGGIGGSDKSDDDDDGGAGDSGAGTDGGGTDGGGSDSGGSDVACSPVANLELVPLDIWGRDLDGAALTHDVDGPALTAGDPGPGVVLLPLDAAAEVEVDLSATDHLDLALVVRHDGDGAFDVDEPLVGRVATSTETRTIDGASCPVFSVYLGLDHAWLAAQGRAPSVNRVDFLMDGEEFWAAVADDLEASTTRISWATWWWESAFELVRPDWRSGASESERRANTAMGRMEARAGVERRVLLNRFWADNLDWTEYLNTDTELRDVAEARGDDFEVVLQGNDTEVDIYGEVDVSPAGFDFAARVADNPRYADRVLEGPPVPHPVALELQVASWHQKLMVFDGEVAFVTGMNTKNADWDTSDHRVFEPLRMAFDAEYEDREAVWYGEAYADELPRKDYGVRLDGPAVRDVEEIFWERWEAAVDADALYAENATAFSLDPAPAAPADGVLAQVVATMPAPWSDLSIAETHGKAFLQAENYIFIEDQYFRAPVLEEALYQAMDDNPDLVLVVVTQDVGYFDGGAKYTWLADSGFRDAYPDRYLLLTLRSWDLVLEEGWLYDEAWLAIEDVSIHSKLRIVDDRYVSLGSCNFNNRGYKYEGELDVAVLDETFATDVRERVLENLVGPEWWSFLSDDGRNNLDVLALAAEENAEIEAWWEDNAWDLSLEEAEETWYDRAPSGFVYPLEIDDDYWFDVGPDAF